MFGLEIVIGVAVVAFFGSVLHPRGRRLWRGAVGSLFSGVEESNPELLFQAAQTDYREKVANYNKALAQLAGVSEQLKRQVAAKQEKLATLETRIQANVDAGNSELAASLAGQHDALGADLAKDTQQYADIEKAYNANVANIKVAQQDYQKKVQSFQSRLAQSKIDDALAEAGSALQNVAFKADDITSSFSRAEEIVNKRSADAAGKARVIQDLGANADELKAHETEQKALDKAALAKFLSKKGQTAAANNGQAAVTQKDMGPVAAG